MRWLGRCVGQVPADHPQCSRRAAEGELGLLGGHEVAVHLMVHIDADAAVQLMAGHLSSVEQNLRLDPRTPDLAAALRPSA